MGAVYVSEGKLVTIVAWLDGEIVGYASTSRGIADWTRHVAELRVVVAESCRGIGLGRWLLELAFETALEAGARKLVARMTPDQAGESDAGSTASETEGSEHLVDGLLASGQAAAGFIDAVPQRFVGERHATAAERCPAGKRGGLLDPVRVSLARMDSICWPP
jgi:hypothetical protein